MEQDKKSAIWGLLETHASNTSSRSPSKQPSLKPTQTAVLSACNITLDYSNQQLSQETLKLLISLAGACNLQEKIQALISGEIVNITEKKPALHTALRAPQDANVLVNNQNIMPQVLSARDNMKEISEKIRAKQWFGYSGKPITDIVNIGIGGSDLGPRFCVNALKDLAMTDLRYHFVSDVDPYSLETVITHLNAETTLFIIASKSFTTQETLYNTEKAITWFKKNPIENHFIAVTERVEKPRDLGIKTILPIWDWVGGRFSLCSAINLITAIAIGFKAFQELLSGAAAMDKHFLDTQFEQNIPVMLGLIGIWNNNFLDIQNLLILTYAKQIEQLTQFIQQLDMESNGKCVDVEGKKLSYATGPLVWGGFGNQAQHSYYQLLCQGTHKITADFISIDAFDNQLINKMCLNKIQVLTQGVYDASNPYACIQGSTPLNHIRVANCSPFSIGALVALYEHKIFVQSVIWNINPFDQPGIDSSKKVHATMSA